MNEFKALERYENGDLTNMFDNFLLLTDKQVELLTCDDYTRYYDYQEELQCELMSLREEFCM